MEPVVRPARGVSRAGCQARRLLAAASMLPFRCRWYVLSAAWVWCAAAACSPSVTYRDVDPAVDYGDRALAEPVGTPTLDVGLYREQLYSPLREGDPCPVVAGPQGGTWLMAAMRTRGVAVQATVECSLQTASGEALGSAQEALRFALAPDGWLEVQSFAIPVNHAPPREADAIDDLYGQEATLACTIADGGGRTAVRNIRILLSEGT